MAHHILVIEHDEGICTMMRGVLELEGFDVTATTATRRASQLAASMQPDLVVLDVPWPDLDCPAALYPLRCEPATAHIPVLVTSVYNDEHSFLAAKRCGADGYLAKPFAVPELVVSVRRLLRMRQPVPA